MSTGQGSPQEWGLRGENMLTPDEVTAMVRLHGLGLGTRRIARELGCSRATVKRYLEAGGWVWYRQPRRSSRRSRGVAFAAVSAASGHRTATLVSLGTTSLRSCSRLETRSGEKSVRPVMLPPGRAKLATKPSLTGSWLFPMTIGMVRVACCAARIVGEVAVRITSTGRWTSSAARSGSRSNLPSADRNSMDTFRPST